jgi:hypothetical protein
MPGIITGLLEEHDRKQRENKLQQAESNFKIANMPADVVDEKTRKAAWDNYTTIVGGAFGLPKQHHGMFGSILAGLGNLNPNPKEQPLPNPLPKGGLMGEKEQGEYKARRQDEDITAKKKTDAAAMESEKAYSAAKLKEVDDWLANAPNLPESDRLAYESQALGLKPENAGRAAPSLQHVMITPKGGKLPPFEAAWNPKANSFVDNDNNPVVVDPDWTVTPVSAGGNRSDSTMLGQLQAANRIVKDPTATPEQRKGAQQFLDNYRLGMQGRALGNTGKGLGNQEKGLTIRADTINLGLDDPGTVNTGTAGIGNGTTSTTAPTTGTTTGAKVSDKPTGEKGVSPKATQKAVETNSPSADVTQNLSTPKLKVASFLGNEKLVATLSKVAEYTKDVLLGNVPQGGRDKFGQAQFKLGLKALHDALGISPEQLSASLKDRSGVADALKNNSERYAAFTRIDNELNNMGVLLQQARGRVPDYNAFLNKLANHIKTGFIGDKETSELVIAVNGFSRVYATLVGGGWTSNAMPHVESSDQANEAIAAFMTNGQFAGVVKQVHREAVAVRKGLIDTSTSLMDQLAAPLGGERKQLEDQANQKNAEGSSLPKAIQKGQLISQEQIGQFFNYYKGDKKKARQAAIDAGFRVSK